MFATNLRWHNKPPMQQHIKGSTMNKKTAGLLSITALLLSYLCFWPVRVDPVAWQAPKNEGFTGAFKSNTELKKVKRSQLNGHTGPEALIQSSNGTFYTATHDGWIHQFKDNNWVKWLNTGGRPLGLDIDPQGNLIAADAYLGLLRITPDKKIELLTNSVEGTAIKYANELDISQDGTIYFSDSSTKFGAKENGGTYEASLLDINEHGRHGRLLKYDPSNGKTSVVFDAINYANGVALSPNEEFILVNETGSYRVLKHWLKGKKEGSTEVLIDNLPGFPDNLSVGLDGRYWIGLASPRSKILDKFSNNTFFRSVIQRLPSFMRPKAIAYGHIIAFDEHGKILMSLQDPDGDYPITTGVLETKSHLYISSLMADSVANLAKVDTSFF